MKAFEFQGWLNSPGTHKVDILPFVRADGYKYMSEWWMGHYDAEKCIQHLTGCETIGDVSCGDRHALQKLLVGPFRSKFTAEEEQRIIGPFLCQLDRANTNAINLTYTYHSSFSLLRTQAFLDI